GEHGAQRVLRHVVVDAVRVRISGGHAACFGEFGEGGGNGGDRGHGSTVPAAGRTARSRKRTVLRTVRGPPRSLLGNTYQFRPEKGRGPPMTEAFIYDAIRTPRGKGKPGGALHGVKPIDLVVGLIDETRRRFPDLDENRISDI